MSVKLTTPIFRASYVSVWDPKQDDQGRDYYSLSMIFDKDKLTDEELASIKAAIGAAAAEKWGKDQSKWPRSMRIGLRDADTEDRTNPNDDSYDVNYVNTYFMNAKTFNKPGIVGPDLQPLLSQNEFYSGCYARATVVFAAYDKAGNRGVGCYLNNLMKVEDGERLGGIAAPEVDFASFKTEDAGDDGDIPF